MSTLKLIKDAATGNIKGASIDDKVIDGFVSATQSLERNTLRAVLTVNFENVEVANDAPVSAPELVATFAKGVATGTTKATITGAAGAGNHFAYKASNVTVPTPKVGDVIADATVYTSGADITGVEATTTKYLGLYELTTENKAVKFLAHTVLANEIKEGPVE